MSEGTFLFPCCSYDAQCEKIALFLMNPRSLIKLPFFARMAERLGLPTSNNGKTGSSLQCLNI